MSSKMQAFGLVFALQKILHCFQSAHNMIHTDIVSRSLSVGKITCLHAKGLSTRHIGGHGVADYYGFAWHNRLFTSIVQYLKRAGKKFLRRL